MKGDALEKMDAAMKLLTEVFTETSSHEVGDALDILSAYREQYVEDNGAFGVGS